MENKRATIQNICEGVMAFLEKNQPCLKAGGITWVIYRIITELFAEINVLKHTHYQLPSTTPT
jgi:hypothetical protein